MKAEEDVASDRSLAGAVKFGTMTAFQAEIAEREAEAEQHNKEWREKLFGE